jgi:hypothetical protein
MTFSGIVCIADFVKDRHSLDADPYPGLIL